MTYQLLESPPSNDLQLSGLRRISLEFGQELHFSQADQHGMYRICSGSIRVVASQKKLEPATLLVLNQGQWFGVGIQNQTTQEGWSWRAMENCQLEFIPLSLTPSLEVKFPAIQSEIVATQAQIERQWVIGQLKEFSEFSPAEAQSLFESAQLVQVASNRELDLSPLVKSGFLVIDGTGFLTSTQFPNERVPVNPGSFFQRGEQHALEATNCRAMTDLHLLVFPLDLLLKAQGKNHPAQLQSRFQSRQVSENFSQSREALLSEKRLTTGFFKRFGKSIPVVRQLDSNDCAAACLTSVLRFYGAQVDLIKVREQLSVNHAGTRLFDLALVAEQRGLHTRSVRSTVEGLRQATLPVICHWEANHYIVVYKFSKKGLVVMDPACGVRHLTVEEFQKGWTGVALHLESSFRLVQDEPGPNIYWQFFDALRREHTIFFDVIVASLFIQILALTSPLLMQFILDRVLIYRSHSLLNLIIVGMVGIALFETVTGSIRQFLLTYATQRIDVRLASNLYRHLVRLPFSFFELRSSGDILKRFSDNRIIRELLSTRLISTIFDVFTAIAFLSLMVTYDVTMTLCAIGGLIPYFVVLQVTTFYLKQNYRDLFKTEAAQEGYLIESLAGMESIKNLGLEQQSLWRYEELTLNSVSKRIKTVQILTLSNAIGQILLRGNTLLLLWLGATMVLQDKMTIGEMIAFQALATGLLAPASSILDFLKGWQETLVAGERISEIYSVDEEPQNDDYPTQPEQLNGEIKFDNISFRYASRPETNVLSNISLHIKPGQTIGIVGKSGSGKSTLAKLLARNYVPTEGRIFIDNQDISRLSLRFLRQNIGIVSQDVFLFDRTIRENIAITDPNAPFSEVVAAAKAADCHEFIMSLPEGYETKLGERAQTISGGQRQRLSIARTFFRKPPIVVLDEATSALDSHTEKVVQRQILERFQGSTVIIIAHRLSTLRQADHIIVLDKGFLVEQGSHAELLAQNGLYWNLWTSSSTMDFEN